MSEIARKLRPKKSYDGIDIDELFGIALGGDSDALDEFCARVRPGLVQIASFRVGNISREDAEDLAHESLLVFVQKYGEVTSSPTAFVRSILYNLISNFLRKRKTGRFLNGNGHFEHQDGTALTDVKGSHELQVENHDLLDRAEMAISAMAEPCRTLLIGLIEGKDVKSLWERSLEIEPNLKRSAFDRRLYLCRRRLWGILEIDL